MTLTHDSPSRTPLRLGPLDDGLRLGMTEYEQAEYEPGYQYELVAGRLRVNAAPNPAHESVAMRLAQLFSAWKLFGHDPGVFDWICTRSRVIDESDPEAPSSVEPDVGLFLGIDPATTKDWRNLTPLLVVEVLSPSNPRKDLVENREYYLAQATIQEYWILDPRKGPALTTLIALVRGEDGAWREKLVAPGGRYETPLLPGLVVDLAASDFGLADRIAAEQARAVSVALRDAIRAVLKARGLELPEAIAARLEAELDPARLRGLVERAAVVERADQLF